MSLNQINMLWIGGVGQVVVLVVEVGNDDVIPVAFAQTGIGSVGEGFDEGQLGESIKAMEEFLTLRVGGFWLPFEHDTVTKHLRTPQ